MQGVNPRNLRELLGKTWTGRIAAEITINYMGVPEARSSKFHDRRFIWIFFREAESAGKIATLILSACWTFHHC
jgi:hypothetical protein